MRGRDLEKLPQNRMRHHAGKEDIFPRYVQRFQEVVLPRPAAGRRHTVAGAISADENEQRIGTLPDNLGGSLQSLWKSAIRLKVARDKGDDGRTAGPEHATVRKPDRSCRVGSKPRRIDALVTHRNAPLRVGGVQTSLPIGGADAGLDGLKRQELRDVAQPQPLARLQIGLIVRGRTRCPPPPIDRRTRNTPMPAPAAARPSRTSCCPSRYGRRQCRAPAPAAPWRRAFRRRDGRFARDDREYP